MLISLLYIENIRVKFYLKEEIVHREKCEDQKEGDDQDDRAAERRSQECRVFRTAGQTETAEHRIQSGKDRTETKDADRCCSQIKRFCRSQPEQAAHLRRKDCDQHRIDDPGRQTHSQADPFQLPAAAVVVFALRGAEDRLHRL